jgi:hypothetical protein
MKQKHVGARKWNLAQFLLDAQGILMHRDESIGCSCYYSAYIHIGDETKSLI